MEYVFANLALWTITLAATFLMPQTRATVSLFAICMIGSTVVVRQATSGGRARS